jgi:hypothetical protein
VLTVLWFNFTANRCRRSVLGNSVSASTLSRKLRGQKERAGAKACKHELMPGPHRFGLAQWPRSYTRPGPVPLPDRGKAPPIHRAAEKRSSRQLSKARGQEKGRGLIAPALLLTSGSRLSQRGCAAASKASELTKCRGLLLAPGPVVVTLCSLEDFPPERRLT